MKIKWKISHPASMYFLLTLAVVFFSWIFNIYGLDVLNPDNGEKIQIMNLLSPEGFRWLLRNVITNFTGFAPLGMVLVAMFGIGLAQHSGFIDACICRWIGGKCRAKSAVIIVIMCGLLSNAIGDAGYIILLPIASALFLAVGLHPIAGIVVAYVSVACGYSANIMMSTLDPIMAATTQGTADVAGLTTVQVGALSNYYFFFVSTFLLAWVINRITWHYLLPKFGKYGTSTKLKYDRHLSKKEGRALSGALWVGFVYLLVILWATFSPWGILRGISGGLLRSPFIAGALFLFSLGLGLMGMIYGFASGKYRTDVDVVEGFSHPAKLLGIYMIIAFGASQMFACLEYSQLDKYISLVGINWSSSMLWNGVGSMIFFILFVAILNFIMVSATAKWSLMAPVFIPAFLEYGFSADMVQCAFRVGDSVTNAITPFMYYMPLVLAYMRYYEDTSTYVTLFKYTWKYSFMIGVAWILLFLVWYFCDFPFGL